MSGVFNSFFLLFKNDAAKSRKDVADLEKQIDSLRAKGKARSAEENQQLKESIARQKELQQNMKETTQATDRLTDSIASAVTAYVGFNALKSGIINTAEFNRQLAVQGKILQQNTRDLRVYAGATKAAGGSEEEFLGFVQAKTKEAATQGLGRFDLKKYLSGLRNFMQGMDNASKLAVMENQGLPQGMQALMLMDEGEFNRRISDMERLTDTTKNAEDAAVKFGEAQNELGSAMKKFYGQVGEDLLPPLTEATTQLKEFFASLDKEEADAVFAGMITSLGVITAMLPALLRGVAMLGAGTGAAALGSGAAVAGGIGLAGFGIVEGSLAAGRAIGRAINRSRGVGDENGYLPGQSGYKGASGDTGGDAMAFWMSQGYTRAQATGIIANEMHESGGNPSARGDNGRAHGLYQWHADRRAKILAATSIDVSTASAEEQRRAAAWEMKNEDIFNDAVFRGIKSPDEAAAYFSSKFERPADAMGEAISRGRTALGIANDNLLGALGGSTSSNSSSVKIDKIEVNTQATDAEGIAGDIGTALEQELLPAYGNFDDGVAG